jgi:hypothetical protein
MPLPGRVTFLNDGGVPPPRVAAEHSSGLRDTKRAVEIKPEVAAYGSF